MKNRSTSVKLSFIIIFLLFLKLLLLLYMYHIGFISVSMDESLRGIIAAQWIDGDLPTPMQMSSWLPMSDWLPGETYLNGFSLRIWDNVIWTPRITAFLFSCLLLVYFIKLVQYLFDLMLVTFLAGLLLVFNPWYIWLSATPMLEIYYIALLVAGFYYFLNWSETRRDLYLVISGIFLALSTTISFESWIFVNTINLCACYYAWEMLRKRDYTSLLKLIVFFVGNNLFIPVYLVSEFFLYNEWFSRIHYHTISSKWYYDGYNIGLYKKLIYYPSLVGMSLNVMGLFAPIGLYSLGNKSRRVTRLLPFVVVLVSLVLYSAFNLFSVIATAAPGRYSLPFSILLIPYSALGIYALFMNSGFFANSRFHRALLVILIIFIIGLNLTYARRFVHRSTRSAVDVGLYLKKLMESEASEKTKTVIVESSATDGDFMSVKLAYRDFNRVLFDGKNDKGTSDLLFLGDDEISQKLRKGMVKFVAVRDEAIKNRLNNLHFMHRINSIGQWNVYSVQLSNP